MRQQKGSFYRGHCCGPRRESNLSAPNKTQHRRIVRREVVLEVLGIDTFAKGGNQGEKRMEFRIKGRNAHL